MSQFTFAIPTKAVPGSNRKIVVNGRIIDVAKGKAGFVAQARMHAAKEAERLGWEPVRGPVAVSYRFFFARPKCHYGTGKNSATLKATAPASHNQRPDLVNLLKCLEDALTGIVWKDDCQIVDIDAAKFWAEGDAVMVTVDTFGEA